MIRTAQFCLGLVALAPWNLAIACEESRGKVSIRIVEADRAEPVPARVHLADAAAKPVQIPNLPFWKDHVVCPGTIDAELPAGTYSYEVERGPEYRTGSGTVTVAAGSTARVEVEMARLIDLSREGWWSGDIHVHRPVEEIELLMCAEDLHVAPVITWWNQRNRWADRPVPEQSLVKFDSERWYDVMAGEDEREGGALLFFHLPRPLAITGAGREYPSPLEFVAAARKQPEAWVDIEKPFWWDVPSWLASGQVDSIGLANNHMCRDRMYENEAWGRPRDVARLPAPRGNGWWSQEIYYHILNCGLRVPPSAGSASGVLPNPVGYNRVYVHLGERPDYAAWWQALRAGRSFVTNGPLLRVSANGQLPGSVFRADAGETVSIDLSMHLVSRDPVEAVEVVQNGEVVRRLTGQDWAQVDSLGTLRIRESGWFLVRAIGADPKTFRFASTAPYYVEIGSVTRRISRSSAQFFVDWQRERLGRLKETDAARLAELQQRHRAAESYWIDRAAAANAP